MKYLLFLSLLFSTATNALEIDEKLTLRVLEVSSSKKTLLVNRGLEDGLVVGDHAKFFLTKGVIARGVVVKASPSRSIWAVYRLIHPDEIVKNNVINLKISSAVKLTDDKTKSIRGLYSGDSEIGEPNDINAGYKITTSKVASSGSDSDEVSALMKDGDMEMSEDNTSIKDIPVGKSPLARAGRSSHGLEVYSLLSVSSLAGTYSNQSGDYDAQSSSMNFSIGMEKYFPEATSFFKNISIKAHYSMTNSSAGTGVNNITSISDMGGGISYYFGKGPFVTNSFMFFTDANFGISTVSLEVQDNVSTSSSSNTSGTLEGSGTFISVGLGTKYLMNQEFGFIAKLDYYQGASSFDVEEGTEVVTDEFSLSGPRVMFGLSYRFL
ncbi:hypothetical protein [Bacteriovorax sp. Seq25_V]|uniref:hypothetical protein n=1 Tax=Bacteriovorax sp. Seq25_V TaxID=1201288 RepID=UPI00038A10AB|nr:hypothetical protein [Bacteriovorax sp. Seq25_V]EQC44905.1 hypothetical protein M900_A0099 [Bacteriovorax sp. Seq25_V]